MNNQYYMRCLRISFVKKYGQILWKPDLRNIQDEGILKGLFKNHCTVSNFQALINSASWIKLGQIRRHLYPGITSISSIFSILISVWQNNDQARVPTTLDSIDAASRSVQSEIPFSRFPNACSEKYGLSGKDEIIISFLGFCINSSVDITLLL